MNVEYEKNLNGHKYIYIYQVRLNYVSFNNINILFIIKIII